MKIELQDINNKIIDKVLLISSVLVTIPYLSIFYRMYEIGWIDLNYFHTGIYVSFWLILLNRKKISFIVKLIFISIIFNVIAILGIYNFGLIGGFFFGALPVLLNGILLGKKASLINLIIVTISFIIIAWLYVDNIVTPVIDLNFYHNKISSWLTYIFGFLFVLWIVLITSVELNKYLLISLQEKEESNISLQHQKNQLQQIFDTSTSLMIIMDKNREIINLNKAAKDFANFRNGDNFKDKLGNAYRCINSLKSDNGCGFYTECNNCTLRKSVKETYSNGKNQFKKRFNFQIDEQGKIVDYVFILSTQKILDNGDYTILVTLENVTEVMQAKEALTQSEEQLNSLISNVPSVVYRCLNDNNWTTKMVSAQIESLTGYPPEDFIDNRIRSFQSVIHPEDRLPMHKSVEEQLSKSDVFYIEYRMIDAGGKIHWVYENGIAIYDDNGNIKYLDGIISDITEKKEVEFELEKYRTQLENLVEERTKELNRTLINLQKTQSQLVNSEKMASLGILTAGIAHEINNPLNFILGGYTGLNNYYSANNIEMNDDVNEFLDIIKNGIDRTSEIVLGLNQFSRNHEKFNEHCHIVEIIENCLQMTKNQTKNKIVIEKFYDHTTPVILGNTGKLHQVFLNLITNSIQAIESEGKIEISVTSDEKYVDVIIKDSGMGINEGDLPKIMDPFYTTKDPGEGTGLGLSITYSILKDHKADISFDSKPGEGTSVSIKFLKNNNSELFDN